MPIAKRETMVVETELRVQPSWEELAFMFSEGYGVKITAEDLQQATFVLNVQENRTFPFTACIRSASKGKPMVVKVPPVVPAPAAQEPKVTVVKDVAKKNVPLRQQAVAEYDVGGRKFFQNEAGRLFRRGTMGQAYSCDIVEKCVRAFLANGMEGLRNTLSDQELYAIVNKHTLLRRADSGELLWTEDGEALVMQFKR